VALDIVVRAAGYLKNGRCASMAAPVAGVYMTSRSSGSARPPPAKPA